MRTPFFIFLFILSLFSAQEKGDTLPGIAHRKFVHLNQPTLSFGFQQGRYSFGEVGYVLLTTAGPGVSFMKYAAVEASSKKGHVILGPKIGASVGMGWGAGLNLIYYSDFHQGTLVFRPEAGLNLLGLKLFYGYNLRLSSNRIPGVNTHLVTLTYAMPLRRRN